MKKIVISLAGLMASFALAPEASAVPSFARQTGMACFACHSQHFPVLNSFGRAFKAGGYTLMGAQGKVEGDHLSIPDALNASMILKLRYQKDNTANGQAAVPAATPTLAQPADPLNPNNLGNGQLQLNDEFALFFGGRVADNVGFLLEGNLMGASLAAGFKIPFVFDVGGAKLSVIPFTTDALGVQYGYEQSSGGVMRANRWAEHRRETSAIQYNADRGIDGGAATGFAFVASNDMGYINLTKWSPNFMMSPNGASATQDMDSTYVRIAATPTVGDWAMVVGAGSMSGSSTFGGAIRTPATDGAAAIHAVPGVKLDTKQTFLDFQAQGEVAGKEMGVYAQYAKAPVGSVNCNAYNSQYSDLGVCRLSTNTATGSEILASDRKAWTIGADYSVIPHVLTIGAAYRNAKTGQRISSADALLGRGTQNNALTLTAVYDLYQNVAFHLNHTQYSGNNTITQSNGTVQQKHLTTFMLEGAW